MQHRFENEDELRREHMTEEESRAVVRLWAERERVRERTASLPSVGDVAEGLQVPVDDARELLAQVRREAALRASDQTLRQARTSRPVAMVIAIAVAMLIALILSWTVLAPSTTVTRMPTVQSAPAAPVAPEAPLPRVSGEAAPAPEGPR